MIPVRPFSPRGTAAEHSVAVRPVQSSHIAAGLAGTVVIESAQDDLFFLGTTSPVSRSSTPSTVESGRSMKQTSLTAFMLSGPLASAVPASAKSAPLAATRQPLGVSIG